MTCLVIDGYPVDCSTVEERGIVMNSTIRYVKDLFICGVNRVAGEDKKMFTEDLIYLIREKEGDGWDTWKE